MFQTAHAIKSISPSLTPKTNCVQLLVIFLQSGCFIVVFKTCPLPFPWLPPGHPSLITREQNEESRKGRRRKEILTKLKHEDKLGCVFRNVCVHFVSCTFGFCYGLVFSSGLLLMSAVRVRWGSCAVTANIPQMTSHIITHRRNKSQKIMALQVTVA